MFNWIKRLFSDQSEKPEPVPQWVKDAQKKQTDDIIARRRAEAEKALNASRIAVLKREIPEARRKKKRWKHMEAELTRLEAEAGQ